MDIFVRDVKFLILKAVLWVSGLGVNVSDSTCRSFLFLLRVELGLLCKHCSVTVTVVARAVDVLGLESEKTGLSQP